MKRLTRGLLTVYRGYHMAPRRRRRKLLRNSHRPGERLGERDASPAPHVVHPSARPACRLKFNSTVSQRHREFSTPFVYLRSLYWVIMSLSYDFLRSRVEFSRRMPYYCTCQCCVSFCRNQTLSRSIARQRRAFLNNHLTHSSL